MPAVCIGRRPTGRSPEHTQNRRLVIGPRRLRQEVEIALDEPRDRGAASRRVSLRAPNYLLVDAERQLRHIRMIAWYSYVSPSEVQRMLRRSAGPRLRRHPARIRAENTARDARSPDATLGGRRY